MRLLLVFIAPALAHAAALAQPADTPTGQGVNSCQHTVHLYEENLRAVQKTLGDKAYADLKARQMGEAEMNELLHKEGYCGVVRVLRARKLIQ